MKIDRNLDHIRLWGPKYNNFLSKVFIQIFASWGILTDKTLEVKNSLSFREALDKLCQTYGFKHFAVNGSYDRLLIKVPVICRSRSTNQPFLLLPYSADLYKVIDHNDDVVGTMLRKDIPQQFDNLIQLYPVNLDNVTNLPSSLIWKFFYPFFTIMVLSLTICLPLVLILGVTFWSSDLFIKNQQASLVIVVVSLIVFLWGLYELMNFSERNYGLVVILFCHDFFRKMYRKVFQENIFHVYAELERSLKGKYFDEFKIIASCFLLLLSLICSGFIQHSLMFWFLIGYGISGGFLYLALGRQKKWLLQTNNARSHIDVMLQRIHRVFSLAQGLRAFAPVLDNLSGYKNKLNKATVKLFSWSSLIDKSYVFIPIFMTMLVLSGMIMSPSLLSLGQSGLVIITAMFSGLLIVFSAQSLFIRSKNENDKFSNFAHQTSGHVQLSTLEGEVELLNISFSYEETGQVILKGFSLCVKNNQLLAIFGPSGSGKTTLLKIMMGFLVPQQGYVIFDGHDLRSLDKHALRSHFGVAMHNEQLFAGSVLDNIVCGRDLKARAVENLLLSHEIFDMLLDLPLGLSTYIFEGGKNVAQKERCLIIIARALVHEPRIIFFDEILNELSVREQEIFLAYLASLKISGVITTNRAFPESIIKSINLS